MTIHEETIAKIRQLPEPMVSEINDFIDFIILKKDHQKQETLRLFSESIDLAELDLSDYLSNLESYEDSLLQGEIQW
jgi:hypothetical protein